jgi:hypothetical protein
MSSPYRDSCIESVLHYSTLDCGPNHHVGPLFPEGVMVYCGECGRVVDVIPVAAQSAHTRYRNRFICIAASAQCGMEV